MQPNGWRALDQLGVASKLRKTANAIESGRFVAITDGKQKPIPLGGEVRCLRRMDLINVLAEDLPSNTIRFGCRVVSVELDPISSCPLLHLDDGGTIKAKIVIGCKGVHSVVASIVGLKKTGLYSIYVTRRFTRYENGHGRENEFVFMSKDGLHLGWLPVDDHLVYWFVIRKWTSPESRVTLAKDPMLLKSLIVKAMNDFPIEAIQMVSDSDLSTVQYTDIRYRPLWEILRRSFWKGAIVVAGDAMHAMAPFLTQGGAASLEDAVVLARCLAEKIKLSGDDDRGLRETSLSFEKSAVEEAFKQYSKERRARVFWLTMETFFIGSILGSSSGIIKLVIVLFMIIHFSDKIGHTRYDCGRL
ncbi:monooxygenase 1-like [Syzygium oleosum]|uniref:monooxygenase 1-like n=1 Tax=Syzygium oleosum TaxID=219896 RepID=UPI0024B915DB|nr:monooxygenase 1-like [Syzygium oleosum]